jgi:pimeloyl-ACP methyl ester carboxylesterase
MEQRMWSLLAPFIDEVGAAAIGRLFLWRRAAVVTSGACCATRLPAFQDDLQQFYSAEPTEFEWVWTHTNRTMSNGSRVDDGYFMSPVHTGFPKNDRVRVRRWPRDGAATSVVGLSGLVHLGYYWFDGLAKSLGNHDIEFWMMDEPFNHHRTPNGFLPGELIAGAGPEQLIAAVWQAVIDARALIAHLKSNGQRVGVVGQSYGGWLSLLLALLDPELEFVVPLIPMCDLPAWYCAGLPLARGARRRFPRYSRSELDSLLRPINPIAWKPLVPVNRIAIHAATRDRMVLYRSIARLARIWGTRFTAHHQGHWSIFFGRQLRNAVVDFICEMAAQTRLPERLCSAVR